jgi:uncharacterized protein YjgD (DUF1641 family)
MDPAIAELSQKIDALTAQVAFLAEEARLEARRREDRSELMRDLTPVANDVFRLSTVQLEEVQEYVDLADLWHLAKRLLRNGRNLEKMLDQLESLMDLLETMGPITDSAFGRAVDVLDDLDKKGYFVFARGGLRILDNIVASYGEEDVTKLGDNIVLILDTVKEMTQPEIMSLVKNTVEDVEREAEAPVNISYRALLGQMRDPNVRRGLAMSMRVLSGIGQQAGATAGADRKQD